MMDRLVNLVKLIRILRERGNWLLIRHCRKQLLDFILCRGGLNRKPFYQVIPYWFYLLKGLDVLVWRLETFGFLFSPDTSEEMKKQLNRYIE